MFIRVIKGEDGRELLLNVDHISKIEVRYSVKDSDGRNWRQDAVTGLHDPDAERWYSFSIGGENLLLKSDPDDPVVAVIEKIYRDAVKN